MSINIKAQLIVPKIFTLKVNKVFSCSYNLLKSSNDN